MTAAAWIPVSEARPPYPAPGDGYVLGVVLVIDTDEAKVEFVKYDGCWRDASTYLIEPERGREVTHWMHVPELPA